MVDFDDAGSIGKRYRREDEIGTPFCVTVDFETEQDGCVTVRDRDTMQQERIKIEEELEELDDEPAPVVIPASYLSDPNPYICGVKGCRQRFPSYEALTAHASHHPDATLRFSFAFSPP